jgi:hypothetical protein
MKIHAYQRPPEYQESPLFFDESAFDEIELFGNRQFIERTSDTWRNLPAMLDDIADEWDDLQRGKKHYTDFATTLEAYTGRDNYTRSERKKWVEILRRWTETDEEETVFFDALQLVRNKEYTRATLRGSCQGDWQHIIYPAEYGADFPKFFEIEYFNLGTEWQVKEDDGDEWSIYCLEDPLREIADATGTDPDNIILHTFDGWERTPKYRVVES